MAQLTNWAGNYAYQAARFHRPATLEQVQALVASSRKLKVLGSRHSFNPIADTPDELVSLELFDAVTLDPERRTVTVGGGVRYGQLCRQLHAQGYALHNLASLPHISVAGACATATHGSGNGNGNLATAVRALELITAEGERVVLSREQHGDLFAGAVVGLGALGVVTQLTLNVEPSYQMRQDVYEYLPLDGMHAHFDEIMASATSVSLFTDWGERGAEQVWLKQRVTGGAQEPMPAERWGATRATGPLHPIRALSAAPCTEQGGLPGPWHERLPHFRMEFTPSSGAELQTEYFVPREHALAAIEAVRGLHNQIAPLLMIGEIRSIAADALWMSPCYQRNSIGLHFTWQRNWAAVQQLLPQIEAQLAPFEARPHWGKLFTLSPARIRELYVQLPAFRDLAQRYDPQGTFRNAFLDTYIFE
jgi:alditol oxidase